MPRRKTSARENTGPRKRARTFKVDESILDAPRFDFEPIIDADRDLAKHVLTINGQRTIDFTSREATLLLTQGILKHHFKINLSLPKGHLVPTIPNRVQYLTWAANLLPPTLRSQRITVLDIGTGPSCIYPILGTRLFPSWKFIATDIDDEAIRSARENCNNNNLNNITVLKTVSNDQLFSEEIRNEKPLLTVCNPPFFSQLYSHDDPAGTHSQLLTDGGEYAFLRKMAQESLLQESVLWFTSLIGCKDDVPNIVSFLRSSRINALRVKTAMLCPGGRTVRWAVAWSFGEEASEVTLMEDGQSKWRQQITIVPGRKYANQLGEEDIGGVVSSCFREMEWSVLDSLSSCSTRCFRAPPQSGFECCEIEAFVERRHGHGDFVVLLKAQQRGQMNAVEFKELCLTLREKISILLNS
ncbi:Ribosomal RNA large subunit methyltransferase F [Gracilariopsis chorda]|uniref:Ribosomal RNA large subunit methyltransferase F n=1 Tax=Gracilariopsis chorda TaxID=448386 RepID=A0A2V3J4Z8_9FLOR|nr:Ribosomal RNA large subunit methyltransferase F [Gracilariopsis chorda]|eukprot:PXF49469.1 Ribosomal RNA large subunit methyltransferase F [Gracilariopsis chorda]